jgi:predicted small secreted protein
VAHGVWCRPAGKSVSGQRNPEKAPGGWKAVRVLAILLLAALLLAGCASDEDGATEGSDAAEAGDAPEPFHDILAGTLTAATPSVDLAVDVPGEGHGRLAFTLVMVQPVPQSSLSLLVAGPSGQEADGRTSPFLYAFPGTRPTMSFASPEAGSWSLRVELSGATADYEVHVCADDAAAHGPESNLACQRY